ncbi:hypothetical protein [Streptomyces sp. NPDC050804]|uniref:hypothetical protein n=1 Tax=Streptomyces sp. NPDC050804 TaxID=3154745 RepID=UPI00341BF638
MSSTRATASSARDAVAANERIRALVDAADASDGTWPSEAYEVLLREWAAALHKGVDHVNEAA